MKNMSKSISDYFKKQTNKSSAAVPREDNPKPPNQADDFYKQCLQNCHVICKKEACMVIKSKLQNELKGLTMKCSYHEDAIKQCSVIIAEKDREIDELRRSIAANVKISNCTENLATASSESAGAIVCGNATSTSNQNPNSMRFHEFTSVFDSAQLATLREVGLSMQKDSKFVTMLIRMLYDGRFECLKLKSVTGRCGKGGEQKTGITPRKMNILKNIFHERIQTATVDEFERDVRRKKLNKLIKDALSNVSKTFELHEREKQACRKLEFPN